MRSRTIDGTCVATLIALVSLGCGTPGLGVQPCPRLGASSANLYVVATTLSLDGAEVDGTLPTHATSGFTLFAGHPVAVPLAGEVSLRVVARLDSATAPPAVYLYGPRSDEGLYGRCVAQRSGGRGNGTVRTTFEVPAGQGGEYLVLVGGNPIARASGSYSVSIECDGDGCGGTACPVLGACEPEVCPNGYVMAAHDNADGVSCPTCECREAQCAPGQRLVFDTCVCDCDVASNDVAVCGADGTTYRNACFAQCHEVPIAAEGPCGQGCDDLSGCELECEHGRKRLGGCPVCECAGPCDVLDFSYRPVCGTDGLTYLNAERLSCQAPGVGVLALGSCRPACTAPADCALSCDNGYLPRGGLGAQCYECACAESVDDSCDGSDDVQGPLWCARMPGPGPVGGRTFNEGLQQTATFLDSCSAKAAGWAPVFGAACPTGLCTDDRDCERGRAALAALTPGDGPPVRCEQAKVAAVGTCQVRLERKCDPSAPQCPLGSTCVEDEKGAFCRFECPCLNSLAARVYDPVCVDGPDGPTTHFNACFAFCQGQWPAAYPGTCCAERLSAAERATRFLALAEQCEAIDPNLTARAFLDTACPPSVETCANEPETCCRSTEEPPAPGGPDGRPGGGPPPR